MHNVEPVATVLANSALTIHLDASRDDHMELCKRPKRATLANQRRDERHAGPAMIRNSIGKSGDSPVGLIGHEKSIASHVDQSIATTKKNQT